MTLKLGLQSLALKDSIKTEKVSKTQKKQVLLRFLQRLKDDPGISAVDKRLIAQKVIDTFPELLR